MMYLISDNLDELLIFFQENGQTVIRMHGWYMNI